MVLGRLLSTAALMAWVVALAHAQAARTARDGVYTDAQAARGQSIYGKVCASCHGADMEGAQGPPLTGGDFAGRWQKKSLAELAGKIGNTMPADSPGSLSPQESADLVAYTLKVGGFPSGGTELPSDDAALDRITWPEGPAADKGGAAATVRVYPPLGNMAQLMRGIFFTNSNLIFTVQTRDPGAPAPPSAAPPPAPGAQSGGFSWVDWGAGIYGGWQLVDNAAIALADASPLMLTPGMRCENGRPAPVTDADWIKYTEQMIAVARKVYQASQSRKQQAVSDATGDLADACANCHRAYRDVRGPGRGLDPTDPSNKSARCRPR